MNINKGAYGLVKNNAMFNFESRGKMETKGKGLVDMYFVSRR